MSWPMVKLGTVADINPSGPRSGEIADDVALDFVPMASVSERGCMTVEEQRPYSEIKKGFTAFRDDDVLLAKITPCFENNKITRATVSTAYAFGSTEFHVLRSKSDLLDPTYLTYYLRQDHIRLAGERRMTGSGGQRRVPKAFLEELPIPLPPLEEQKRIAGILDQADALRRLRARALENLTTLGPALFRSISQSVTDNAKIEDISEVNPRRRFADDENFEVFFLPMSSLSGSGEVVSCEVRMLDDVRKGFTYFERGDILIAKITPCFENGKGCLYCLDYQVGFGSTEYHVIRPHKADLAHWLHFATRADAFRLAGESAMTGSAGQKRVPSQFVKTYSVPVPDEDKVRYFNENIERIRSMIQQAEVAFSSQDALFSSLQSTAFQGRL